MQIYITFPLLQKILLESLAPKCLTQQEKNYIHVLWCHCIVSNLCRAFSLVPVVILFYASFELPFPKAVIPNSHYSISSFTLSRQPFSCSTEEIEVTSRNPLNFLSLYLFLYHYHLFSCLQMCPFFLWLIQFYRYLLGTCYVPGTISKYSRYSHEQNKRKKFPAFI